MITSKTIANGLIRAIFILALMAALMYILFKIQMVIIYLLVSLLLSCIGNPIVVFLKTKLKFNNIFAVITVLALYTGVILGFFTMFIPLINSQATHFSLLDSKTFSNQLQQLFYQIETFFQAKGINTKQLINQKNIINYLNFDYISLFLNSVINMVSNLGMGIASCFFITFFLLKDKKLFLILFKKIIPDQYEDQILNSLDKIDKLLLKYLSGIILQLVIIFVLYIIVLLLFKVENPFIIAFICAVLNIIPYIGPLIASFIALVLTLLGNFNGVITFDLLYHSFYVLVGFFVVQLIDNNISQPLIFSNSTNSHPLEIFLIILTFGFLFGITGMVIAVPSYTILKVIAKEFFPDNKYIYLLTKNL